LAGYHYNEAVVLMTTMPETPTWLLLICNLPGRNATVRMRLWRALKATGAGMMRDGAYVLPSSDRARQVFEEQSVEIKEAGGLGHIVSFHRRLRGRDAKSAGAEADTL
jgi:DNA-binding transcriptional regulator PaaX